MLNEFFHLQYVEIWFDRYQNQRSKMLVWWSNADIQPYLFLDDSETIDKAVALRCEIFHNKSRADMDYDWLFHTTDNGSYTTTLRFHLVTNR